MTHRSVVVVLCALALLASKEASAWFFFWIPTGAIVRALETKPDEISVSYQDRVLGKCGGYHVNQAYKFSSSWGNDAAFTAEGAPPEAIEESAESKFHKAMAELSVEKSSEKAKVKNLADAYSTSWGRVVNAGDMGANLAYGRDLASGCVQNGVGVNLASWKAQEGSIERQQPEPVQKAVARNRTASGATDRNLWGITFSESDSEVSVIAIGARVSTTLREGDIVQTCAKADGQPLQIVSGLDDLVGCELKNDPRVNGRAYRLHVSRNGSWDWAYAKPFAEDRPTVATDRQREAQEERQRRAEASLKRAEKTQRTTLTTSRKTSNQSSEIDFSAEAKKSARILGCTATDLRVTGTDGRNILFLAACREGGSLALSCDPSGLCLRANSGGRALKHRRFATTPTNFKFGLAPQLDASSQQWGYTNPAGQWVVEPIFGGARSFDSGGWAAVAVGTGKHLKWGYINAQAEWVVPPQFSELEDFDVATKGFARVRVGSKSFGEWKYLSRNGELSNGPAK